MRGPRHTITNPDRHLECQEALEPGVIALVEDGKAAGWSIADLSAALISLADNLMLADAANGETERQIADALARFRND